MVDPNGAEAGVAFLAENKAKDGVITKNGRALFKELIVRRDPRLARLMADFQSSARDSTFVDAVQALVEAEAHAL